MTEKSLRSWYQQWNCAGQGINIWKNGFILIIWRLVNRTQKIQWTHSISYGTLTIRNNFSFIGLWSTKVIHLIFVTVWNICIIRLDILLLWIKHPTYRITRLITHLSVILIIWWVRLRSIFLARWIHILSLLIIFQVWIRTKLRYIITSVEYIGIYSLGKPFIHIGGMN